MTLDRIAIVGSGRVGLTLARALTHSGSNVVTLGRERRQLPEPLAPTRTDWAPVLDRSDLVLVAVPDDAITAVAGALARTGVIARRHVVLHTSGLHDRSALGPLEPTGAALGSWHPLQTFVAEVGDPDALAGSAAVIEGDSRALEAGRGLAARLHLGPVVELPSAGKAGYHAAAVFASNYLVVLAEVARRLGAAAGAGDVAAEMFMPLMQRTLANYATGAAAALTGPIRRGDAGTVQQHLAALTGAERMLYVALGREALQLARDAGLEPEKAAAIQRLLTAE